MLNNFLSSVLPQDTGLEVRSSRSYNTAVVLSGLLAAGALAAGLHALLIGHEHAYNCTREIPWGLLIAAYVFFVVTSTGLCLVSAIGHVFNVEVFKPIAKRSVFMAIVTIVAGFMVIGFEIENTWRMPIYNVLSPNPTSNIWWMGTLYGAYLFFMVVEFALLQMGKHKQAGILGLLGLVSGIAAHSNLGAVFGLLSGREFWHGPYMPIYFITSAMMSGCAAVVFFTWIGYKANGWKMSPALEKSLTATAKLGATLIAVIMFFTTWKMISGISGHPPGKYEAMMSLVSGPYAINFWFGEVMLGLLVPFIIILSVRAQNMKALFLASVSGIIGIFFMRYDLVIVGMIVPHFHGMGIVDQPDLYSYFPSMHEIMITVGALGLCCMGFLMGERLFKGHLSEDH
ncbi:MAG: polysulfide reductase NrfD [Proteobacteria bacterium]|nr:polysulfide reductase NrfD [Pseudomonadota bacterium]MBU1715602.1 polysulfide reductase NrfD [Pseudomonadota bacterium]